MKLHSTAIILSSFLKDDRWPDFPRAAQCAAVTSLTMKTTSGWAERLRREKHVGHPPGWQTGVSFRAGGHKVAHRTIQAICFTGGTVRCRPLSIARLPLGE
jgi:hypothetical protein